MRIGKQYSIDSFCNGSQGESLTRLANIAKRREEVLYVNFDLENFIFFYSHPQTNIKLRIIINTF